MDVQHHARLIFLVPRPPEHDALHERGHGHECGSCAPSLHGKYGATSRTAACDGGRVMEDRQYREHQYILQTRRKTLRRFQRSREHLCAAQGRSQDERSTPGAELRQNWGARCSTFVRAVGRQHIYTSIAKTIASLPCAAYDRLRTKHHGYARITVPHRPSRDLFCSAVKPPGVDILIHFLLSLNRSHFLGRLAYRHPRRQHLRRP